MKIPYDLIIYGSIVGGVTLACLQYLKERKSEKEMYRESKRNERVVNDLVKALNDINLDELKRRLKIFR